MIDPRHKEYLDYVTQDIPQFQNRPELCCAVESHLRGKFKLNRNQAYQIVKEYRELLEKEFSK